MKNTTKRAAKLLITFFAALLTLTASGSVFGASKSVSEEYNYEYKYYFSVPIKYEDKIVELASGHTIQLSETTYITINAENYYSNLDKEVRNANKRKNFALGAEYFDETFNDETYMLGYFEKQIKSIRSDKEIVSVEKQELNKYDYWVCNYNLYKLKMPEAAAAEPVYDENGNPIEQEPVKVITGQGRIYFTVQNGYSYNIVLHSNSGNLVDEEDALGIIDSFYIGQKTSPVIYIVWVVIAAVILVAVYYIARIFFNIDIYSDVTETIGIADVKNALSLKDKPSGKLRENEILLYRLDCILGRINFENFEMNKELAKNEIILKKINQIYENYMNGENDILKKLDIILGRVKPSAEEVESAVLDGLDQMSRDPYDDAAQDTDTTAEFVSNINRDDYGDEPESTHKKRGQRNESPSAAQGKFKTFMLAASGKMTAFAEKTKQLLHEKFSKNEIVPKQTNKTYEDYMNGENDILEKLDIILGRVKPSAEEMESAVPDGLEQMSSEPYDDTVQDADAAAEFVSGISRDGFGDEAEAAPENGEQQKESQGASQGKFKSFMLDADGKITAFLEKIKKSLHKEK